VQGKAIWWLNGWKKMWWQMKEVTNASVVQSTTTSLMRRA